ncbi:MAG: copper resistance protein [Nitrospiraceae bacterium]|nr:MAG: copper resistance protein [Nitrospiraceae bacterium]
MKNAKTILLILTAGLLLFGIAHAKDYEVRKKAGGYDVNVKIDKNPPVVGKNNMAIEIKDSAGKNVTDAKLKVEYSMPAMPGMPAMNYKTDAELKDEGYKAIMDLPMSGSWNVEIKIARDGKTSKVKFSVDAQ